MLNKTMKLKTSTIIEKIDSFNPSPNLSFRYDGYVDLKDISVLKDIKPTNLTSTFANCKSLSDISVLSTWDVSECFDYTAMFYNCNSLSDASPIAEWKMPPNADTKLMFHGTAITDFSIFSSWFPNKTEEEIRYILCS